MAYLTEYSRYAYAYIKTKTMNEKNAKKKLFEKQNEKKSGK